MRCSLLLFLQPLLKAQGWLGRNRWDISCAPQSRNIHPESLTSGKKMLMLSSHVAKVEVHVCTWALQLQWKIFCRAKKKKADLTFDVENGKNALISGLVECLSLSCWHGSTCDSHQGAWLYISFAGIIHKIWGTWHLTQLNLNPCSCVLLM